MKYGPKWKPFCNNTFYGGDLVITYHKERIYFSNKKSLLKNEWSYFRAFYIV